jgi:hypothetical protein
MPIMSFKLTDRDIACSIELAEFASTSADCGRGIHGGACSLLLRHVRVCNAANVPQLGEDMCALSVDGVGDLLPCIDLLLRPDAWSVCPLGALTGDERALSEDEAGTATGSLFVVFLIR